ncbi:MAG: hypothetical protein IJ087_19995 [Eggerthellaceae bacterium]|nr:hypothetical protein [Eggerthellaceae bacterium]
MPASTYFARCAADERKLAAHGFDTQPDMDGLTDYAFGQADKLDALIAALGMEAECDMRGRWHVARVRREAV